MNCDVCGLRPGDETKVKVGKADSPAGVPRPQYRLLRVCGDCRAVTDAMTADERMAFFLAKTAAMLRYVNRYEYRRAKAGRGS